MNISKICESKYFADPLLESLYGHIRCLVSVVVPSSSCGWHPYDKQNRFQTMGQNHTYCPLNKNNKKPLYDFKYMYKCINICHQIIYLCNFQEKKYLSKQQPNHLLTHFPPKKNTWDLRKNWPPSDGVEGCDSGGFNKPKEFNATGVSSRDTWPQNGEKLLLIQVSFLVPWIGGRWYIIPQLAVYTTYIPLIYIAYWVIIYHLPPVKGTRNSCWLMEQILQQLIW